MNNHDSNVSSEQEPPLRPDDPVARVDARFVNGKRKPYVYHAYRPRPDTSILFMGSTKPGPTDPTADKMDGEVNAAFSRKRRE